MRKDWDSGFADRGYTGKSSHSTTPGPYDWSLASQPHAAYRVSSIACEQRWTLGMVAVVEVAVLHLRIAATDGPAHAAMSALACSTFL